LRLVGDFRPSQGSTVTIAEFSILKGARYAHQSSSAFLQAETLLSQEFLPSRDHSFSLPFIMAGKAAAQYGGGTSGGGSGNGTYVPPKGGYSSATRPSALVRLLVQLAYFSLFTTVAVLSVASNPEKTVCVCWMKARTSRMP